MCQHSNTQVGKMTAVFCKLPRFLMKTLQALCTVFVFSTMLIPIPSVARSQYSLLLGPLFGIGGVCPFTVINGPQQSQNFTILAFENTFCTDGTDVVSANWGFSTVTLHNGTYSLSNPALRNSTLGDCNAHLIQSISLMQIGTTGNSNALCLTASCSGADYTCGSTGFLTLSS